MVPWERDLDVESFRHKGAFSDTLVCQQEEVQRFRCCSGIVARQGEPKEWVPHPHISSKF